MRVLNNQVIARQRAISEANMPETVTVTREGAWVDEGGGSGYFNTVTHTVQGRLAPLGKTPMERTLAEQQQDIRLERLTVPLGADIATDDEVSINGVLYNVVGAVPLASYSADRVLIVRGQHG